MNVLRAAELAEFAEAVTAPLRAELEAVRREVAALRAQIEQMRAPWDWQGDRRP